MCNQCCKISKLFEQDHLFQKCKMLQYLRHAEQEERSNDNFLALSADDLADKNGLKPTEILMLSYLEKYSSGKPIAKFWHYDYGVYDVWPIIKKLESMGFADFVLKIPAFQVFVKAFIHFHECFPPA